MGDVVEDTIVKATTDWGIFRYKWYELFYMFLIWPWKSKIADLVTIGQKLKIKITKIDKATNKYLLQLKL